MAQNSRKRILKGAKQQPHLFLDESRKSVLQFYQNYTVQKTSEHRIGKVCALKLAVSFPELCAMIYVIENQNLSSAMIRDKLVKELWSASLNWDTVQQNENKAASKEAWDAWGTGIGQNK